jgi:hypothetical protein
MEDLNGKGKQIVKYEKEIKGVNEALGKKEGVIGKLEEKCKGMKEQVRKM